MKWFVVVILSMVNADGIVEKEEVKFNVAYNSMMDCEVMAPQVATDYFDRLVSSVKEFENIMVGYRCEKEKLTQEAVWKSLKL